MSGLTEQELEKFAQEQLNFDYHLEQMDKEFEKIMEKLLTKKILKRQSKN